MPRNLINLALIVGIVWLVFSPALSFEFINFDDGDYIYANPAVQSGISWAGVKWAATTTHGGHWHPLTWIGHMLVVSTLGTAPSGHHAVNIAIHTINALLVFVVMIRLGIARPVAFAATIFWAISPLRIESVAWAAQLKEVLSQFFLLVAVAIHLGPYKGRYKKALIIGLFILSLVAKPTAIVLPVILMLLDWWRQRESYSLASMGAAIQEQLPLFGAACLFGGVFIWSQAASHGLRDLAEVSMADRIEAWPVSFMVYLGKFFWPLNLAFFYPRVELMPGVVAGFVAGCFGVFGLAISCRRKAPEILFGSLWLAVSTLPMSGILAVGGQAYADRWTYLGHVGLVFAAASLLERLGAKRATIISLGACLFVPLATRCELSHWHDSKSLMLRAIENVPDNFMAQTNLSAAYLDSGELARAVSPAEEAVRVNPTYPEALNNLGVVRAQQARFAEARELFQKALLIRPKFEAARQNLALVEQDMQRVR